MTAASVEGLARVARTASGPALATVARLLGDLQRAEDAVQDAFEVALRTWPARGVPDDPAAWLATVARNRAIDHLRRESSRRDREAAATRELPPPLPTTVHPVADDQLRLLATCCHPALSVDAQVALTLRLVCGLRTADIARLFLTSEPTVAQRLSRAKRKLRDAPIPLRAPTPDELPARLGPLLACIELVFTRGYAPVGDARVVVDALCDEGRRLAGLLAGLLPDEPEVRALHALLLFQDSRRTCRADDDGRLVLLAHQDRTRWDHATIAHGVAELTAAELVGRESPPGRYRLQAAIAGEHATAPDAAATDWHRIVALYDRLATVLPSPVVSLNRAVAVAERDGPDAGLAAIAGIADEPRLARGHRLAAVRAELLHRAGRVTEARDAYEVALAAAPDGAERRHLDRRREELETSERSRWRGPPTPDRVGVVAGQ